MEDNAKLMESLLDRATDYGKTSLELLKLKALDKTSDVASSVVPHTFVFAMIASFLFFLNMGIAFWLGEVIGKTWSGFFLVAAFYGLIGLVIHFIFHKKIKNALCNYIIKQVLN
jgi:fatty acid desaturase